MFGEKKYAVKLEGSHPGDSVAFVIVILIILGLAAGAYASISQ